LSVAGIAVSAAAGAIQLQDDTDSRGFEAVGVVDELAIVGDIWVAPTAESLASLSQMPNHGQ
jgi:hypothetical protein